MSEENIMTSEIVDPPKRQRNIFRTKECRVIEYNARTKNLDVDFDGYGVRIPNVDHVDGTTVTVKYKSKIGKPDFICKL